QSEIYTLSLHDALPICMSDTAFFITPGMRQRLAKVHQRGEDGALTPLMEFEIPQNPEFEMGGGGLYGTVGDYLKFIRMILNDGRDRKSTRLNSSHVAIS